MRQLLLLAVVMLIAGCQGHQQQSGTRSDADELLATYTHKGDFEGALRVIDSLEQAGVFNAIRANRSRGACYLYLDNPKKAEYCYREAYKIKPVTKEDKLNHFSAAQSLSDILKVKYEYEEALRVLLPAIKMAEDGVINSPEEYSTMLFTLGECQYKLGRKAEATKNLEKGYALKTKLMRADTTGFNALTAMEVCFNMAATCYDAKDNVDTAMIWLKRSEEALDYYKNQPTSYGEQEAIRRGYLQLQKALLLYKKGKNEEAEKSFADYQQSLLYQTEAGKLGGAEYLYNSKQWDKAADHYEYVDSFFTHRNMNATLQNIQEWMVPRYLSCANAGQTAKTIAVGRDLCQMLDSAIAVAQRDKAAELATIYETQQKEAQIAQQQAELSHQRIIGLFIAVVALFIFFIIYMLIRHRAAARLAEVKAAQERIESELRIARDIQMSMVPSIFPEREGLDMYASMTPAKEVGGDLYGYLMQGDQLYFAVGDVSGKGVPASLFMAQATRLFLTLAKQGMKPAEICTHMNDALSGADNENGMFVTFWLGMLDLQTGHLDFCNAGHNPPVIGGGDSKGEFLKMEANAPIGLWPDLKYVGEEIDTIKGRPLFIYTDGLNEAENPQQEQFGDKRLLDILRNTHFDSAQQVVDTLKAEVEKHRNGAEPNDDLTMMCLRCVTQ
jgi:serine phosphatase RsbU (regulator of sigma subunit)